MTVDTGSRVNANAGYGIRRATLFDLLAIRWLEKQVFPHDAYGLIEILVLFVSPGMHNLKLIAPDGALAGFAAAGKLFGLGRTWIVTIGIHPDHQRRGLGRWLLAECEARITTGPIYLTVRRSNARAQDLYLRNGYREFHVRRGYYPNGEDGIEMRKDLDPPGIQR
jgi:ribosomal-protein-alanine N-acetyltransferase